ncbi:Biopolymer transport protein ExbB [Denitratisoma oestradiolicum]|uniref:Biopolymer transport protein ExbB n=2 Tax=Denitratisoma oestradiolicum TaxID=311182 RepID=A0A6S6XYK0_9PROT|nr:MotA/TolQ/ExbB proton channel family protein [Denitratisoma oestradiolicum]CAB1367949.1 Biopolymer transport protein ExbB [Denitratisoma oestradiolicum]
MTNRFTAFIAAVLIASTATVPLLMSTAHAEETPAATTPAAAAEPAAPAAVTEKATVDNPYGLEALWMQGDFVAKTVLITLVIMSMGTWYIGIAKYIEQAKLLKQGKAANEAFWRAGSVQSGLSEMADDSAFRFIAENGVKAATHHEGTMVEQIDLNEWVTMSIQRAVEGVANRMQGGLAFLATVGSTAPFVGLFGTVWGIYHALTAIGIAGQASIDKVAGPVGEALIMTAIGLAVAVPAVLGYNWLVRRNKIGMDMVKAFGADLHMVLISGGNKTKKGA